MEGSDQAWGSFGGTAQERRTGNERRSAERRVSTGQTALERRAGAERRSLRTRRTMLDRRTEETAEEHLRNALQLLGNIAEAAVLNDELRRDLDSAMLRLRFAVDRLERA